MVCIAFLRCKGLADPWNPELLHAQRAEDRVQQVEASTRSPEASLQLLLADTPCLQGRLPVPSRHKPRLADPPAQALPS